MSQSPNEISNQNDNPIFDIINSIQNKLNDQNLATNNSTTQNMPNNSNDFDLSKVLNLLGSSNMANNNTPKNQDANFNLGNIMNLQNAFGNAGQSDPRKDLLMSLKPFLRETRQKNIDTYITFLGVIKALNIFTNKGSE